MSGNASTFSSGTSTLSKRRLTEEAPQASSCPVARGPTRPCSRRHCCSPPGPDIPGPTGRDPIHNSVGPGRRPRSNFGPHPPGTLPADEQSRKHCRMRPTHRPRVWPAARASSARPAHRPPAHHRWAPAQSQLTSSQWSYTSPFIKACLATAAHQEHRSPPARPYRLHAEAPGVRRRLGLQLHRRERYWTLNSSAPTKTPSLTRSRATRSRQPDFHHHKRSWEAISTKHRPYSRRLGSTESGDSRMRQPPPSRPVHLPGRPPTHIPETTRAWRCSPVGPAYQRLDQPVPSWETLVRTCTIDL